MAHWLEVIICGFVKILPDCLTHNNQVFGMALVSRRSRLREGTRYWRRGADVHGNVANEVETEQILFRHEDQTLSSFLQLRGSIPFFWTQLPAFKVIPPIVIDEGVSRRECESEHSLKD